MEVKAGMSNGGMLDLWRRWKILRREIRVRGPSLAFAAGVTAAGLASAQQSIELRALDGDNGFVLNGINATDRTGAAISAAGDLNGDGWNDLLIGGPGADIGGDSRVGRTYVVHGRNTGFSPAMDLSSLNGGNGFVLNGIEPLDDSGWAVSAAGDINGDGRDDFLIGAPSASRDARSFVGESYVVFGRDSDFASTFDLSELSGSNGFVIEGWSSNDRSGIAVSPAGDINGDGLDDVLIGESRLGGGSAGGVSFIVFGRSSGFPASVDPRDLDGSNGFRFGQTGGSAISVSAAGDVNGDGLSDVIMGKPDEFNFSGDSGATFVVFGSRNGFPASVNLHGLDGGDGFVIWGINPEDSLGQSVSGAGDVNGDGLDDLIIGAPNARPDLKVRAGESYVVFGRDIGFPPELDLEGLDGSNGFVLAGINPGDGAGTAVSAAGDVNGDGLDDVLVGAPLADRDGKTNVGESYVVFGRESGFPAAFDLADLNGGNGFLIEGIDAGDLTGSAVSTGGDIDGDGLDDLLVGAPFDNLEGTAPGRGFVVFGNGAPLARSRIALLSSQKEDSASPSGSRLETAMADAYLDTDPFGGIAIIAAPSSRSFRWEYSRGGASWQSIGSRISDASAVVLASTDLLRFVPGPDFFGRAPALTARLWDGRWREPGDAVDITSAIGALGGFSTDEDLVAITVDVTPVNDAPSFVAEDPPAVNEDPGGVTVAGWASFEPGAVNESGQIPLVYEVANISNAGLFSVLPTIDTLGNLAFDTRGDASGTSTFDVRVIDNGGIADGGVDVSAFHTFTVTVNAVNDAPMVLAEDPPAVAVNAGPQEIVGWASFNPGAFDESAQSPAYEVLSLNNPALFETPPVIDAAGTLRYAPAAGAEGNSQFTVEVRDDGGTANGGEDTSRPRTFTIRVGDSMFSDSFEN